jgi:protein-L-isoaspartate(D-aspartate) O-methyltransferase
MTQMLALDPADRVLEIGTGSGYQCAVLSQLAAEVVTVERQSALSIHARQVLEALEINNVTYALGDGTLGWPPLAPFDGIVVTAGAPRIPPSLVAQLALGGRLVIPVGSREEQILYRVRRTPSGLEEEKGIGCRFVPLVGAEGWPSA